MADAGLPVSNPEELSPYAVRTYRYLRLAIVIVLLALAGAVLIERLHASCWEESISAYYYTPAHSIFVGALVALGVCLIAIRGNIDAEDVLMNVAGVLAPIVAFVPTSRPTALCTTHPYAPSDTLPFINNNLVALGLALGAAVVLAAVIIMATARSSNSGSGRSIRLNGHAIFGVSLSAVLLIVGVVWYVAFRSSFLDHAHGGGAAALFAIIGVVILINGISTPHRTYGWIYIAISAAMAATVVVVIVIGRLNPDWRHQILWLEIIELGLLLGYWGLQTVELWKPGVPTGPERENRTATARSTPQRVLAAVTGIRQRDQTGDGSSAGADAPPDHPVVTTDPEPVATPAGPTTP
jgi:hypothetical protein